MALGYLDLNKVALVTLTAQNPSLRNPFLPAVKLYQYGFAGFGDQLDIHPDMAFKEGTE